MTISQYGFSAGEFDAPNTITAYVSAWHEHQGAAPWGSSLVGSYGVVYAGLGHEGVLWGGGTTTSGPPMLGHGIRRLLRTVGPGVSLNVYAHEELGRHIGPFGHVRAAMKNKGRASSGKHFAGFVVLSEIATAMDKGSWTYRPLIKGAWTFGLGTADQLANGPARDAVLEHRERTSPSFTDSAAAAGVVAHEPPPPWSITVEGP